MDSSPRYLITTKTRGGASSGLHRIGNPKIGKGKEENSNFGGKKGALRDNRENSTKWAGIFFWNEQDRGDGRDLGMKRIIFRLHYFGKIVGGAQTPSLEQPETKTVKGGGANALSSKMFEREEVSPDIE